MIKKAGLDVGNIDVHQAFGSKEEYVRALEYLWEHQIGGWW